MLKRHNSALDVSPGGCIEEVQIEPPAEDAPWNDVLCAAPHEDSEAPPEYPEQSSEKCETNPAHDGERNNSEETEVADCETKPIGASS